MRGRNNNNNNNNNNNRRSHNPGRRVYESKGPGVKIRGTGNQVAEKYLQLAPRDTEEWTNVLQRVKDLKAGK